MVKLVQFKYLVLISWWNSELYKWKCQFKGALWFKRVVLVVLEDQHGQYGIET